MFFTRYGIESYKNCPKFLRLPSIILDLLKFEREFKYKYTIITNYQVGCLIPCFSFFEISPHKWREIQTSDLYFMRHILESKRKKKTAIPFKNKLKIHNLVQTHLLYSL
jgi:hypothetical protein